MSALTFTEFCRVVTETMPTAEVRYGQHWFNVLRAIRPDLAELVRATQLDPFHRETVSDETISFVVERW